MRYGQSKLQIVNPTPDFKCPMGFVPVCSSIGFTRSFGAPIRILEENPVCGALAKLQCITEEWAKELGIRPVNVEERLKFFALSTKCRLEGGILKSVGGSLQCIPYKLPELVPPQEPIGPKNSVVTTTPETTPETPPSKQRLLPIILLGALIFFSET